MGALVVIEQAQRAAAKRRDRQGVALMQGPQQKSEFMPRPIGFLAPSSGAVALAGQHRGEATGDDGIGDVAQIRPALNDRRQRHIGEAGGSEDVRNVQPPPLAMAGKL